MWNFSHYLYRIESPLSIPIPWAFDFATHGTLRDAEILHYYIGIGCIVRLIDVVYEVYDEEN